MSIYQIQQNIENFMFFMIDDLDIYDKMEGFNIDGFGQPLEFDWVAPKAEFNPSDSGARVLPDITQWNGNDLILSSNARIVLEGIIKSQGEFYALGGSTKDYSLFNPINKLDNEIIDLNKTKSFYFEDGSWDRLEILVLNKKADQLAPPLFTIGIDGGVNLYCTDQFKSAVEETHLRGLDFKKIY